MRVIFAEGLLGTLAFFLWIYCILDVIATDGSLIRNLPKLAWLLLVIVLFDVGAIAWLLLGRPQFAAFSVGSTLRREPTQRHPGGPERSRPSLGPPQGPEDSPGFMRDVEERRLRAWEEDLRRREDELRQRDEDN